MAAIVLGGCLAPPPQVEPIVPESPPVTIEALPPFVDAWTAVPDLVLYPGGEPLALFTRLEVVGGDSLAGWRVRCAVCDEPTEGRVAASDLVHHAAPVDSAAWGPLPGFALALRSAAASHDLAALESAMVPDFSYSLIGPQTPAMALESWRSEDLRFLDRLPDLLDRGLTTRDSLLWSAPPAFTEDLYYRGPRAGFRRNPDGRWVWLFFIQGLRPDQP